MVFDFHSECFCAVMAIQVLGIVAMVSARISEQTSVRAFFQFAFLGMLLAIGGGALAALAIGSEYGLSFGITLSIMAVGATLDLRPAQPAII